VSFPTPNLINLYTWLVLLAGWVIAAGFTRRTTYSEHVLRRLLHIAQMYVGFALIFYHPRTVPAHGRLYDVPAVAWLGTALTIAGVLYAVVARVHLGRYWSGTITLKEGHRLITTGPYRLTRHPLYTGFVIGVFGSALTAATAMAFAGAAIIFVSLVLKLRREEVLLSREFGDEHRQFRRDVPAAILPYIY
jgi:protein-S-isoprenylcysteine O-methyltransferase Ste14